MKASIKLRPDDLCVLGLVVLKHMLLRRALDRAPTQGPWF